MGLDDVLRKASEAVGLGDVGATGKEAGAVGKLMDRLGGLDGLLGKFDAAGLGDKVRSWVSTGKNKPVTKAEVKAAIGSYEVKAMARDAGEDEEGFADKLAAVLPKMVDKLTPDGAVPGIDELKSRFSKLFG